MKKQIQLDIKFAILKDYSDVRFFDPHSKYINPEKIRAKLQNNEIIIAVKGFDIIGLIKFSYFWATRPFIDLIYVKENQRNLGVGRKMLDYLENYLQSMNYSYLFSSAEERDEKAITWHEKNGFVKCGKVECLNLPHDKTPEIFFYKRISKKSKGKDRLLTYPLE